MRIKSQLASFIIQCLSKYIVIPNFLIIALLCKEGDVCNVSPQWMSAQSAMWHGHLSSIFSLGRVKSRTAARIIHPTLGPFLYSLGGQWRNVSRPCRSSVFLGQLQSKDHKGPARNLAAVAAAAVCTRIQSTSLGWYESR